MPKDLICLVADKNMEFTVEGLFSRAPALGIRLPTHEVLVHPEHDPGCLWRGHDFLRPFANQYVHAIVMLDRMGCGREQLSCTELERQIEEHLSNSGWNGRAAAIVIDPELEAWAWVDSSQVDEVLGWHGRVPGLRAWLSEKGWLEPHQLKPDHPKEAVEAALRQAHRPRSSALYLQLAQRVSLHQCGDPAFVKFKTVLQNWFPLEA